MLKKYKKLSVAIQELDYQIKANRKSIKRLYDFASGKVTLKNKDYTIANEQYEMSLEDIARIPNTVQSLIEQNTKLEQQLAQLRWKAL